MIPGELPPEETRRVALQALWTFPSILASAFVVAWGAEAAQIYISQGLALAILAWIQVLPEFAVEAVISWHRDIPLMTANFTGALRLLTGLGWPMIWTVYALSRRRRGEPGAWPAIELEEEHAAEVVGLVPPVLYFGWIIAKGTLDCVDAAVLLACYGGYLTLLQRLPPRAPEDVEDMEAIPRAIVRLKAPWRPLAIFGLLGLGGFLLYRVAEPFLESMVGLASVLGVSQFVFVQWVAPFLSEFPEFTTTFYWARGRNKAGMALMNMVSSNIVQWTVLAAMIPIVFSLSLGHISTVPIAEHRVELVLTLLQSLLGMVLLANLNFHAYEALGLFALWFAQLLKPGWREEVAMIYAAWLVFELISALWRPGRLRAFRVLPGLWRRGGSRASRSH